MKAPQPHRWRRRLVISALAFGGLALVAWLLLPLAVARVPLPPGLLQPAPRDAEIVDRHGRPLREVYGPAGHQGERLPAQAVAENLVRATLAAEDARFWEHRGVDWLAVARAAGQYVWHRRVVSGASTITMQLVKLAQPRPRTLRTKVIEAAQAMRLEQVWGKERILAEYLNRLDYGHGRLGSAAAAAYYFGKAPAELSAAEAALLAGIPQAPSRHNPHAQFARVKKRQAWILGRMADLGWLTEAEHARAAREPVKLLPPRRVFQAPHFVDLVQQLENPPPGQTLRTTLDLELNRIAGEILRQRLARLEGQNVRNGAVVVLDNRTGDVLALVGSEDYFGAEAGQVNGAWAPRSAGSAFKPFTYCLAFERGATPATIVADVPAEFATPTGVFAPVNYNRQCHGPLRHRLALANSLNIPAVRVLETNGGAEVLQARLQACGLGTLTQPPAHYGLGLTIGNAEARLLELASAYACLARLGVHQPFRLAADRPARPGVRVFDARAAWLIADILSDNAARALAFGAQSSLAFDFPVACKTGTSSDFRDNWAFGYTPEFTVGVWVGNFSGEPMREVSGVTGAAPVMHEIMVRLRQRAGTTWYARPAGIVERAVHPLTGRLVAADRPGAVREQLPADQLPPLESPDDYDAQGRVKLPAMYREWFAAGGARLAGLAVLDEGAVAGLRITSPLPGTTFFLDPDLPGGGSRVPLKAEGGGPLEWRSATLRVETGERRAQAVIRPGRHELTVRDGATGAEASTWIEVKAL